MERRIEERRQGIFKKRFDLQDLAAELQAPQLKTHSPDILSNE